MSVERAKFSWSEKPEVTIPGITVERTPTRFVSRPMFDFAVPKEKERQAYTLWLQAVKCLSYHTAFEIAFEVYPHEPYTVVPPAREQL